MQNYLIPMGFLVYMQNPLIPMGFIVFMQNPLIPIGFLIRCETISEFRPDRTTFHFPPVYSGTQWKCKKLLFWLELK